MGGGCPQRGGTRLRGCRRSAEPLDERINYTRLHLAFFISPDRKPPPQQPTGPGTSPREAAVPEPKEVLQGPVNTKKQPQTTPYLPSAFPCSPPLVQKEFLAKVSSSLWDPALSCFPCTSCPPTHLLFLSSHPACAERLGVFAQCLAQQQLPVPDVTKVSSCSLHYKGEETL